MLRTIALAASLFSLTIIGIQGQVPAESTALRVTRVILYKTGVGYFEHLGTITGNQSIAVQFTADQLDDVLKSLTAVDLGEGRVTGISYDSPTPVARRLQALKVPLSSGASRLQLLDALRGSRVEVRNAATVTAGRVLHVERRGQQTSTGRVERDELTLVSDAGEIVTLNLDEGTRVRVADQDLRQDVARYLDIASSNGDRSPRRVVLATVGAGQRQLLVSYVGEAAVWKTSYRLVFPSASGARPVLQGWAIVDNVSATDWDDVELSLVAGAPQAFRQTLSAPLFASRPLVPLAVGANVAPQTHAAAIERGTSTITGVVRDTNGAVLPGATITAQDPSQQRIGSAVADAEGRFSIEGLPSGTVTLRAELVGFSTVSLSVSLPPGGRVQRDIMMTVGQLMETVTVTADSGRPRNTAGVFGGNTGGRPAPPPPPAAPRADVIEQRVLDQVVAAAGADLGDLFEYRLKDRVTIKRNQSALVPILQTAVNAERISLWNDATGVRPRRAVWLTNTSDLTLDAGSVTVVDAGAFGGEGLVDPIKPGERRLLSFASDLAVQVVAARTSSPGRMTRLRIADGIVIQSSEERQRRSYTMRNEDREPRVVVIEHPARADWKIAGETQPEESTATVHRFRATVPRGQTLTLHVDEIKLADIRVAVREFHSDRLTMVAAGETRIAVERALAPLFAKSAEIDGLEDQMRRLNEERETISGDQGRVRQNMAVLKGSSTERQLLERYTRQLDAQETRLEEIRQRLTQLEAEHARAEQELAALIQTLRLDITP